MPYIITGIAYIIVNCIIAGWMQKCADEKGHENENVFVKCFFLGIFGVLYVIALPDLKVRKQNEYIIHLLESINNNAEHEKSVINNSDDELPPM